MAGSGLVRNRNELICRKKSMVFVQTIKQESERNSEIKQSNHIKYNSLIRTKILTFHVQKHVYDQSKPYHHVSTSHLILTS